MSVPRRPNACDIGGQAAVDFDVALPVQIHTDGIKPKIVCVGLAACSDENIGRVQFVDGLNVRAQPELDSIALEGLLNRRRHVVVFLHGDARSLFPDHYVTAHALVELRQFQTDMAAADHGQALGEGCAF